MTSAVPKMKQPPAEGQRPEMYYAEGGMPEQVSCTLLVSLHVKASNVDSDWYWWQCYVLYAVATCLRLTG